MVKGGEEEWSRLKEDILEVCKEFCVKKKKKYRKGSNGGMRKLGG